MILKEFAPFQNSNDTSHHDLILFLNTPFIAQSARPKTYAGDECTR